MRFANFLVPALLLGLAACNDDGGEDPTDDTDDDTAAAETARIRLTHLGVFPTEESAVDIFVNGENAGITFSFGDTTDYVELPVGTYDFAVVPAGGTIDQAAVTVDDFALAADESWAIVAQGYVAPEGGQPALSVGAFQEDYDGLEAGTTRLNVFHSAALPAFDPVDVWVVDGDCAPVGNEPLIDNFAYGAVTGGVDIPAGAIGVGLDVGGDATVDACFQVPDLGDALVNVFASNDNAGAPFLLAQLPEGRDAELLPVEIPVPTGRIRLTHLGVFPSGMNSSVDVWVNGAKSDVTFSFQDVTDYVELPAGEYDFAIVPSGGALADAAITVDDFALGADEDWSIFANGYVAPTGDQPGLAVGAFKEDNEGLAATQVRLNVVHGAALPALNPVDVWLVDANCAPTGTAPLLDNFNFGDVEGSVDIDGAIGVGFDIGGNATVDACFQVPDLGDGTIANVYAVSDVAGNVSIVAQLPEGNKSVLNPVSR